MGNTGESLRCVPPLTIHDQHQSASIVHLPHTHLLSINCLPGLAQAPSRTLRWDLALEKKKNTTGFPLLPGNISLYSPR